MHRLIAWSCLAVAIGLSGCNYSVAPAPTGVAAPGHNWLEGGD